MNKWFWLIVGVVVFGVVTWGQTGPYSVVIGQVSQSFATFAELQAFVAAYVEPVPEPTPDPDPVPTPDPEPLPDVLPFSLNWHDLWPTYDTTTSMAQGPAGWLDCTGYPERRNWMEAQWHDAADGDLEHARHFHIGGCFPETVSGVFQVDLRVVTFHWNNANLAGLRKNPCRTCDGIRSVTPAPVRDEWPGTLNRRLDEHMTMTWLPFRYDTRGMLTDGRKLMEWDFDITRDDGVHHLVRLQVPITFANGGGRSITDAGAGSYAAEGWMTLFENGIEISPFGYLRSEVYDWIGGQVYRTPRFDTDAENRFRWRAVGVTGRTILGKAMLNPDLHQHPPDYGTVLQEDTPQVYKQTWTNYSPVPLAAGQRFVFRASDQTPGLSYGSAATLMVIGIGPNK